VRWLGSHRIVAGITVVVLLLLLGLAAARYVSVYQDLRDGRGLLGGAAELMERRGLDITGEELDSAEQRFLLAREKLDSASDTLRYDPLVLVAGHLPWLGTQVRTGRDLMEIGIDASDIGVEAVGAMRAFQEVRETQEGALSEKVVPVLEAVKPNVAAIEQELTAVQERRTGMADDQLVGFLSSAVDQLDNHIGELETRLGDYRRAARMAPKVLGYDKPQTYLVLAHDNTEILATGGFILVYGFITLNEGRLERLFFDNVANINPDWPPTEGEYIEPPRPLRVYLLQDWPMGLAEASWWADFPTVARNAIELYHTNGGNEEPIDGVIGINFLTLEKLLEVIGPITVDEYGVTVSSEDVTDKLLIVTHPLGTRLWEQDRYDFAGYLAEDAIERTLGAPSSQWASLLSALRTIGEEKNLLLYHSDDEVQNVIADVDWDGGVRPADGDYLMVVDSSVRSTKLNLVVRSSISVDVTIDERGDARNLVTIAYTNDYSTWAQGKDPHLAGLIIAQGSLPLYANYLRLLAPGGSDLAGVAEGGTPVGAEDTWSEDGKAVFARYFLLPTDTKKELEFAYAVPSVVEIGVNPLTYRLLIQKQPGTSAIPLRIVVHPPPGLKIVSRELDGEELDGNSNEIMTDLRTDRELVVRYGSRN
jgi:hypothetical protein